MDEIGIDVPEIVFSATGSVTFAPGTVNPPYRGDERSELAWYISGSAQVTTGGERYDLAPRSVLYFPSRRLNQFRYDRESSSTMGMLVFHLEDPPQPRVLRRLAPDDIAWGLLCEAVRLERQRPPHWERAIAQFAPFLVWSVLAGGAESSGHDLPDPICRMLHLVSERWRSGRLRTPSLEELAEAARVTPSHLCKVSDAVIGCSPVAALRMVRVGRAASLLRQTMLPIGRIAQSTGFESSFHFSRVFAAATGSSPTAYRAGGGSYDLPEGVRRIAALV